MALGSDIKLGAAVETLGTVKGAAALGSDIKLGAAVETLGTVKGTAGDIKLGAAVETLGSVVIDSNEPDAWEVVVNKGTEYVLPDAPDILLI